MKAIIALAVMLIAASAIAGTSAGYGMGGQFARFDPVVAQYNQSGELLRIEGHCQSACTLFLAVRNVCIDRNAELLFHASHDRERNVTGKATNHLPPTSRSCASISCPITMWTRWRFTRFREAT